MTNGDAQMVDILRYREYFAWLQPGSFICEKPFRLEVSTGVSETARQECITGMERVFGKGCWHQGATTCVSLCQDDKLPRDSYKLSYHNQTLWVRGNETGVLYGVFVLLRCLVLGERIEKISDSSSPAVPNRAIVHWDRPDGSIERGYAGHSLFFQNGRLSYDPDRIRDYARLLASVGINILNPNNVNVNADGARLITPGALPKLKALAGLLRPYGIRLSLSVNFDSPIILDGLSTSDPFNPMVVDWWQQHTDALYEAIPDFEGYLVKADSEFQGGPSAVGRSQADGANLLARALAPHGGRVYWRCFVYNCVQDWRDSSLDRPCAAYDLFMPLDGQFESNVILQIKYGPSDFQVREPNSPLLGAMEHTQQALELQITQEYTGQQVDLYNLAVQWEEVFAFPTGTGLPLRSIAGYKIPAISGVSNVGGDENWTGHTLAQLNLFAFGRMAWNPCLTAEAVTDEWTRLTFGNHPVLRESLTGMLMKSRSVYEKYNTPLGLGWMVNVSHHYGPNPDGYEFSQWGTYHRADCHAIGVDRTGNGTGFTRQYPPALSALFEDPSTCPEALLLFFHRLPYNHLLKSGQTLLQYIYDCHFEGVEETEAFIQIWDGLRHLLPDSAYTSVRSRLIRQAENAREWRDVINTYFRRLTGVPDIKGRKIYD